jgi:tRNA U34 5-methylaminomethyl-2-thiouridine-forming methyltransferase MnmC
LKREFLITGDGSVTIHLPEWNEQYHSKHGAIAEANHVFIKAGLQHWVKNNPEHLVSILEIGFGTGLNAFLTFLETSQKQIFINYTGVEAFPISSSEIENLNYPEVLKASEKDFLQLHKVAWEKPSQISSEFNFTKRKQPFSEINDKEAFFIIYFDAFGARVQPELWTVDIFKKMYDALKLNGILVTYSAKGSVRRAMQTVGFTVERLPGPPGKREMLRATKWA